MTAMNTMNITAPAQAGAVMPIEYNERLTAPMMKPFSRIMTALAALALLVMLYVPVWRIDLRAPQYPEGLYMQIHMDHFSGDVEKINGLNHYIGMQVIKDEMFPEFRHLPKVVVGLCVLGLLAAAWGRIKGLGIFIAALSLFGLWALYDMYKWGHDYGHNLDPRAAIKVEGMVYQPPLIGHKQLLNFDAWSTPDIGGWLLFGVMALLAVIFVMELRTKQHVKA
jgi:copper chaperone NosL